MSKISGYANSVSSLGTDDLLDVSEKISSSPDVYESELLPFSVTNVILKDLILANEITVTNYNYYDHFAITEQLLKPDSVVEFKSYPYNKCAKLKIKFNNKVRNTIKRNYL